MTSAKLLGKSLLFHWRGNLAVLLGVVVGTAVLTGALLVGDSQRGSLRNLALRRLGWIDQALVVPRFFREQLADELKKEGAAETIAPVLLLQGSVSTEAGGRPRAARKVTILGIDQRFFPDSADSWLRTQKDVDTPFVYLNAPLARQLNVQSGDPFTLHLQRESSTPRESLLGHKKAEEIDRRVTLKAQILAEDAAHSQVSLVPSPEAPRNAFVYLPHLQDRVEQLGKVNALFAGAPRKDLQKELNARLKLEDWNLKLRPSQRRNEYLSLESERLILEPAAEKAVLDARPEAAPTLVYLANRITVSGKEKKTTVPYSVVAAVDLFANGTVEKELSRHIIPVLGEDDIILMEWENDPWAAKIDDKVEVEYYRPDITDRFETATATFRVAAIVRLPLVDKGRPPPNPLADRGMTPQVRGVTDRVPSRWNAPFPLNFDLIRTVDDNYWDAYGATPRAYVSLERGKKLWASRFGDLTSYRIVPPDGDNPTETIEKKLLAQLDPAAGGFVFDQVREHALEGSRGGTDFAMLFLAFSFFLILAALLLVGLLFRLNLDRRAREVGVLLASGYRLRTVRWLLLLEGMVIAAVGAVLGLGVAVLYGDWLLGRLREWWPGGLDRDTLQLHVTPLSMILGFVAAMIVTLLTIAWAVRGLGKMTPRALIQGQTGDENTGVAATPSRRRFWTIIGSLAGALACLVAGFFLPGGEARAGTFFGSGMLLLVAGVAALSLWMRRTPRTATPGPPTSAIARLGVRNATRHPSRSLLTAGLLASAAFLLVGVESFRRKPGEDFLKKEGGSGGYALLAESDAPLYRDINSEDGRGEIIGKLRVRWQQETPAPSQAELKQREANAEKLLREIRVIAFRVRAGDDASCLNLYQPRRPRVLGVPDKLIDDGGFAFAKLTEKTDEPWRLLNEEGEGETVPVFGEQNTVVWMLKSGLDQDIVLPDWQNRDRSLHIAGLLHDSVFQSALLMSDKRFKQLFPEERGYRFFLIQLDDNSRSQEVKEILETAYFDRGFEVTASADRLASFLAVENMYLSTFQALGGMGLLLGTLGLAVVLLRSVWERRGELALLRALGYRRGVLGWLVLTENGFLLLVGLALGTLAALLSVAPHVLTGGGQIAWLGLLGMLGLALLTGLLASTLATAATVRAALVPALRRE